MVHGFLFKGNTFKNVYIYILQKIYVKNYFCCKNSWQEEREKEEVSILQLIPIPRKTKKSAGRVLFKLLENVLEQYKFMLLVL